MTWDPHIQAHTTPVQHWICLHRGLSHKISSIANCCWRNRHENYLVQYLQRKLNYQLSVDFDNDILNTSFTSTAKLKLDAKSGYTTPVCSNCYFNFGLIVLVIFLTIRDFWGIIKSKYNDKMLYQKSRKSHNNTHNKIVRFRHKNKNISNMLNNISLTLQNMLHFRPQ